jgi:hypothetical protein
MPNKSERFSFDDSQHDLVLKYNPRYIGQGSESIVFEIPSHPEIVAKGSIHSIRSNIDSALRYNLNPQDLSPITENFFREKIKNDAKRFSVMKAYFGSENVANQKKFLIRVPINNEILNHLYEGNPPLQINETWAVVTFQRLIEEFGIRDRLSLVSGYSEFQEVSNELYKEITDRLIFGVESEEPLDENKFLDVQKSPALRELLEKSKTDEELRSLLKDLIAKSIIYTNETGEILDLAGTDNIVISKLKGKWTFKIVDGMYPGSDMISNVRVALSKLSSQEELGQHHINCILNVINYTRTINGMAEILGLKSRIDILPKDLTVEDFKNINFQEILK